MKSAKHAAPENAEYEAPEMWYLTHEILQLAKEIQASLASSEREDAEEQDPRRSQQLLFFVDGMSCPDNTPKTSKNPCQCGKNAMCVLFIALVPPVKDVKE